jgi:glutamate--cysteine ligase
MDLDPFEPAGISADTARFIDVFLLHCLQSESPPDSPQEIGALARNQQLTASRGREPGLKLERAGQPVLLVDWAAELLEGCLPLAAHLDRALGGHAHRDAVTAAQAALAEPQRLPSARALQAMRSDHGGDFLSFVDRCSRQTRLDFLGRPLPAAVQTRLQQEAEHSVAEQASLQAEPDQDFERFRQQYTSAAGLA